MADFPEKLVAPSVIRWLLLGLFSCLLAGLGLLLGVSAVLLVAEMREDATLLVPVLLLLGLGLMVLALAAALLRLAVIAARHRIILQDGALMLVLPTAWDGLIGLPAMARHAVPLSDIAEIARRNEVRTQLFVPVVRDCLSIGTRGGERLVLHSLPAGPDGKAPAIDRLAARLSTLADKPVAVYPAARGSEPGWSSTEAGLPPADVAGALSRAGRIAAGAGLVLLVLALLRLFLAP